MTGGTAPLTHVVGELEQTSMFRKLHCCFLYEDTRGTYIKAHGAVAGLEPAQTSPEVVGLPTPDSRDQLAVSAN